MMASGKAPVIPCRNRLRQPVVSVAAVRWTAPTTLPRVPAGGRDEQQDKRKPSSRGPGRRGVPNRPPGDGDAARLAAARPGAGGRQVAAVRPRSEEHTSELQSLMRISYAVFCLKKKNTTAHKQS